jgi:hypothetical protein
MVPAGGGREVEFKFRVDGRMAFEALARTAPARRRARRSFKPTTSSTRPTARWASGVTRCGLREEDGRFVLTAKGPGERAGVLTSRAEEEVEVPKPRPESPHRRRPISAHRAGSASRSAGGASCWRRCARSWGRTPCAMPAASRTNGRALDVALGVEGRAVRSRSSWTDDVSGGRVHYEVEVEIAGGRARPWSARARLLHEGRRDLARGPQQGQALLRRRPRQADLCGGGS